MLCIGIFGGASLVRLLLCNASLVHCFLVLGAIYFWCCVFGAMHCQLYRSGLLPQWHIFFMKYTTDNTTVLLRTFGHLHNCTFPHLNTVMFNTTVHIVQYSDIFEQVLRHPGQPIEEGVSHLHVPPCLSAAKSILTRTISESKNNKISR